MLPYPAPFQPPIAAVHTAQFGFGGVRIGAALAEFRRAFPNAACTASGRAGLDCRLSDQPLGGGYYARDLTYRFVDGRLTAIQFHTSIDAFAFAVAKLKHEFGAPADIRRNTATLYGYAFPHVTFTWRNGRSTIVLSDPSEPNRLSVTMSLNTGRAPEAHDRPVAATTTDRTVTP
jgi:hypothetical protein